MNPPRSQYARLLLDFPDIALVDHASFQHRGHWNNWLRNRIGPTFIGKIIFEIGCFDAEYLCRIAAQFPHTAFIGLDWKYKAVHDGARRIAAMGLSNIILLRGRAQDIRSIFEDGEIDEIWIFHPDPCDRPVELKNRLFAEPFLVDAHAVLRNGDSTLTLKTDHPGYYQWALRLLNLAEPSWFDIAREHGAPLGELRSRPLLPRIRSRDLVLPQDLPEPSDILQQQWSVGINSADLWNDPAARSGIAGRLFAGEKTLFESRFVAKRLPIYFLQMTKSVERQEEPRAK